MQAAGRGVKTLRVNEIVVGVSCFEVNKEFGAPESENVLILIVIRFRVYKEECIIKVKHIGRY